MTDGRNEAGQFTVGNTFSDGRNKYVRAAELRAMFCDAVTTEEVQSVAHMLARLAADGEIQAAKLLLQILFDVKHEAVVATQQASDDQNKGRAVQIASRIVERIRVARLAEK